MDEATSPQPTESISLENPARFYLDHAATSWPKPPGSFEACIDFQNKLGSASGRGVYQSAERSNELVRAARTSIAKLIGAEDPMCVGLGASGTHALNAAILGLLQSPEYRGSHVLATVTEHNSVLRPLEMARKSFGCNWEAVGCDENGVLNLVQLESMIRNDTRLVIINHASNVTGAIQSLEAIGSIVKKRKCTFMVDAAQTLGYVPIQVQDMGIDILAAPGHKGAGGMLGTGILYVSKDLAPSLLPLWIGGTGLNSDSIDGPFDWLSAFESGNANLPGIASLQGGVDWVLSQPPSTRLNDWTQRLVDAIGSEPSLRLVGPVTCTIDSRVPVVSFISSKMSCHEMALLLDFAFGIEARSGFHCAALVHESIGTKTTGGTLRLSLGHTSCEDDIVAAEMGIQMLGSMTL